MVRETLHRQENDDLLLQPAMLETRLQTPHDGTEDGAAPYAGDAGIALVAGKAGILHLFAGSTSDGCKPPVHLQTGKGRETPCIPAQRKDVDDTESRHRTHAQKKPYERLVAKNDFDITEYYTAEEIAQKYKVNAKWVWTYTRQHKVPKVRIRQFNYYSKKHIDAAFAKYEVDSDLTEWYTPEDIQEKYGMTRVAIRSHVYRNNILSKKEHGQIFYSKLHFDLSKNSAEESKAEYYTVKEAMEKFKLSRDSVYNILQFHQISREKNGRFVRFLKVDFDRVMGVRK